MDCFTIEELRQFYLLYRTGHRLHNLCPRFKISMAYGETCLAAGREIFGTPVVKVYRAKRQQCDPGKEEPLQEYILPVERRKAPHKKRVDKPVKNIIRLPEKPKPQYGTYVNGRLLRPPAEYSNHSPMRIASAM